MLHCYIRPEHESTFQRLFWHQKIATSNSLSFSIYITTARFTLLNLWNNDVIITALLNYANRELFSTILWMISYIIHYLSFLFLSCIQYYHKICRFFGGISHVKKNSLFNLLKSPLWIVLFILYVKEVFTILNSDSTFIPIFIFKI